ncbi:HpcH/HpaI aldolase/citrate lyase family protein [Fusibacter ferrireducens]|uniref:HpcH/HpaI aldolase/citrate lyase family protein n=1 Tax=Fusibacter ferrireducens TaxID=2785058 RepID=A0ABR9ZVT1_9FIRM|nr:aldolase/citrate lyase family protein [Fusibacter ferrireducens]MBF4694096.1 HpcH/HpaI aldolase/citrate lyase family protein [Fusibacter ferrireducens]
MKKKLRRTMLFCPANKPKHLFTSMIYEPDCIIFDLEDAVPFNEKVAARDLLVEALKAIDYGQVEVFARINALYTDFGEDDVRALVPAGLKRLRLPMCESEKDVKDLDVLLTEIERAHNIEVGSVKVQCAIETPKGVVNSLAIAQASPRVTSISFGAEDFTRTLGTDRTKAGNELFLARSTVALNANIAGVDAIDTVYADVKDEEGFIKEVESARNLGFSGKSCIHPSQVELVHKIYTPNSKDIEASIKIIEAARNADIEKGGVIVVDGKMIDIPVIAKAERILELAVGAGIQIGGVSI